MAAPMTDATPLSTSGPTVSYNATPESDLGTEKVDVESGEATRCDPAEEKAEPAVTEERACKACLVCIVVFFLLSNVVAYQLAAKPFLATTHEYQIETMKYTPENALTDDALKGYQCQYERDVFRKTATAAMAAQTKLGWNKINLPARTDDKGERLMLTAYYMPSADGAEKSPTVVVQHGNNVNINDHTVQTIGFFLRMAGYNVLMANLRNHGDSSESHNHVVSWANEEVYDLLGAWDYAVQDPDGVLGGKKDPAQVAIMGFSMGGYIAKVAFGMEPRVPALLTDGAVQDARELLKWNLDKAFGGQGWLLIRQAWYWCKYLAGYNLDELSPGVEMPRSPQGRKLAIIHGNDDEKVPIEQNILYKNMLTHIGAGKNRFFVEKEWYDDVLPKLPETTECSAHCRMHLTHPKEYCKFVCEFFTHVFGNADKGRCATTCKFE